MNKDAFSREEWEGITGEDCSPEAEQATTPPGGFSITSDDGALSVTAAQANLSDQLMSNEGKPELDPGDLPRKVDVAMSEEPEVEPLKVSRETLSQDGGRHKWCRYSGPGRGDCEHFISVPELLNESTTDEYGIPHGWCDYCWASRERDRFAALAPTDPRRSSR